MKVIFIAGPYRADSQYQVGKHIRAAENAAQMVWMWGGVALCPHLNTALFEGLPGTDDDTWLQGTMELLRRCDAVLMVPGWPNSEGAKAEREEAERLGLPVFFGREQLAHWLKEP